MKLPNFVSPSSDSSSKIGHDFGNKVVQKLILSINNFYKKRAPKQLLKYIENQSYENTVELRPSKRQHLL